MADEERPLHELISHLAGTLGQTTEELLALYPPTPTWQWLMTSLLSFYARKGWICLGDGGYSALGEAVERQTTTIHLVGAGPCGSPWPLRVLGDCLSVSLLV